MNLSSFSHPLASREKMFNFLWQHILLLLSLYVMALGVVLCVRSGLGSSVISSVPLALTLAGEVDKAWQLSLGDYTNLLNCLLVLGQIFGFATQI